MGFLPFVESISKLFQKDFNTIINLPMLIELQVAFAMISFCYAQRPSKLTIFPSPMWYQIWCSYHNYVIKTIEVNFLWHHGGPFGLLLGHFSCFFRRVRPSLNGPMRCPYLFRLLSYDHPCISFSLIAKWSPYSFQCDGTCRDRY
jgi:hypothetical protein